jgi:hypothetical protein
MRVMTRAHVGKPTAWAGVITRAIVWFGGDADERIVCSLTIRKVFVLTLSFQAKVFL